LECYFFFFQAEDGIRDRTVTGVQTCALPILATPPPMMVNGCSMINSISFAPAALTFTIIEQPLTIMGGGVANNSTNPQKINNARSEERRVGKESRYRST